MRKTVLRFYTFTIAAIMAGIGTGYAQGASLEWAKKMGGSGYDYGNSVVVDAEKNVYVTGYFMDDGDFHLGSGKVTSRGGQDIFVTKQDAAGNVLWMQQFGGSGRDGGNAITLDTAGNIYVAGYFSDTAIFDPNNRALDLVADGSMTDIFVCKLDNKGDVLWTGRMGSATGDDEARGIALDAEGNVHTTGLFFGVADFDPGSNSNTLNAVSSSDIFVSKLNNNGQYVWAKSMGGVRLDQGEKIAVDRWGYVYTTGQFQRLADFDPGPNPYNMTSGAFSFDVFISKLDKDGNFVWAKQFTGSNPNMGTGLALDYDANVYTTGNFSGSADFDPGTGVESLVAVGSTDIFLSKLDSAGNYVWAKAIGGADDDRGYAVTVDGLGHVFTTGYFSGTVDFNPGGEKDEFTANGSDIFVAKFDSSGQYRWAKQFKGGSSQDWANGIAVDGSGNVYSTGLFNTTVDFDPGTDNYDLKADGGTDIFVHKLICNDTTSSSIEALACTEYTFFGNIYTESGTYQHIVQNSAGCDSTITLVLEVRDVEAHISVEGFKLRTTEPYERYQWFLNGTLIEGATDSIYVVTENGQYSVAIVNDRGCTDTSEIYTVSNVPETGISAPVWADQIKIYPNPVRTILNITTPVTLKASIYALDGRRLMEGMEGRSIDVHNLEEGLYILQLSDQSGHIIQLHKFAKLAGL